MIPDGERFTLEFFFDEVLRLWIGESLFKSPVLFTIFLELGVFKNAVEGITGMRSAWEFFRSFVQVRLVIKFFVESNSSVFHLFVDIANLDCGCLCCRCVIAIGVDVAAVIGFDLRISLS